MSQSKAVKIIKRIVTEQPEIFEALVEFEKTGVLPHIDELKERKRQVKKNESKTIPRV